jgi:hypothetical protein
MHYNTGSKGDKVSALRTTLKSSSLNTWVAACKVGYECEQITLKPHYCYAEKVVEKAEMGSMEVLAQIYRSIAA